MKFRTALVAAGVLAIPAAAMAQPVDGLYVGAGVGYNYLSSESVKSPAATPSFKGAGGVVGAVSVGFGLGGGFRVEGELSDRSTAQSGGGNKARNNTYGVFVNGLFDFDVGAESIFPYAGVGVGYAVQNMSKGSIGAAPFSGSKGGIAGQLILGAAIPVPDVAGLSVTAEYRLMDSFQSHSYGAVKLGNELNHSAMIGLRYAIGVSPAPMMAPAPAPAPVVAPAPAPARTYLVFFDWDRADLTARAKQIISEAAANAARVKLTRIEVSGHADKSGTAGYNQKLSQARADNVAAELVRLGVPQAEIAVMAFGDTHPLVPTAAGVREPQNRRVEIVLK